MTENNEFQSPNVTENEKNQSITHQFKVAIKKAVRSCNLSVYHIAAQISEIAGYTVSPWSIENACVLSHKNRSLKAELIPALCLATGCMEPLKVLVNAAGCSFQTNTETMLNYVAELNLRAEALKKEKEKVLEELRKQSDSLSGLANSEVIQ